ncbi:glycogen debranching protein [Balneolaceae bacterium YR4-1]|uniref:Glycogen debranching protein n=1 Tax=Halalkalibaculum roseum TaxID=2709311 RepID=A0A6M1SWJ6_9BACT|nr:glycogen debranching protein [Halalkalibaculum roseum]NGP76436.1 glycogen debranching protein [Halalkalibaculum roseum]
MKNTLIIIAIALLAMQCTSQYEDQSIAWLMESTESAEGKSEYLESPYVTAGDKLYMVGHQNGSFPDLGWHVEGEMGGIWNHPIKLMDGFSISVTEEDNEIVCLDDAHTFINHPTGNRHLFTYSDNINITRTQFVPDGEEGVVIELAIDNKSNRSRTLNITFNGKTELLPVWLSDSLNIKDGPDKVEWDESNQFYAAVDSLNSWHVIFGSNQENSIRSPEENTCNLDTIGRGDNAAFTNQLSVEPNATKTIQYVIAGSSDSREEALETYKYISTESKSLLTEKMNRFAELKNQSRLEIPDKDIEKMYTWMKYNTDWLIRDVEGVGRGLSAGIPDYPWWFAADNAYALQGWLATGRFEDVLSTIDLLYKLSGKVNGNGRVIHEASTNGVVYNKGNTNETPHIIYLLWKYYEWTGNKDVLERYYDRVKAGLNYLLEERDPDGNRYPNGHGMMEIRGLDTEMIDVAVYTQQALAAASKMAEVLGFETDRQRYAKLARDLEHKINEEWWVPESNSYADFRATKSETLSLIEDAIVRSDTLDKPWAVEELEKIRQQVFSDSENGVNPYVVHHNWVVNTPLEMGIADSAKAQHALETARNYTSRFGMYVTGIDRDEDREESNKWEVFSYVGAVMTLPTGVQAISEVNYGNIEESYNYLHMLENSFGYALPGSMYEVSPDYGMIVQAWNIYSVSVPIVEHYFGIKPKAFDKEIIIRPNMPDGWKNASLKDVRVGDNSIGISKVTESDSVTYIIEQEKGEWKLRLELSYRDSMQIMVNGSDVEPEIKKGLFQVSLEGENNRITIINRNN